MRAWTEQHSGAWWRGEAGEGGSAVSQRRTEDTGPDAPATAMPARRVDILEVLYQQDIASGNPLAQGKALVAQKAYAEAIPFLERATQHNPRSFDAWANLGFAYTRTARLDESLVAYDRALALNSRQAWVWSNKGHVLNELERYEEALVALDHATVLNPTEALTWNKKAVALYSLNRYYDALDAYELALSHDANLVYAWVGKGMTLRALEWIAEAEQAERRAKELGWQG